MKKNVIYVLYSLKHPYLPIDFAESLQEVSARYNIPLKTLRNYCHEEDHIYRASFTMVSVMLEENT